MQLLHFLLFFLVANVICPIIYLHVNTVFSCHVLRKHVILFEKTKTNGMPVMITVVFLISLESQFFMLFNIFLLLFTTCIVIFGIIYESRCIISSTF